MLDSIPDGIKFIQSKIGEWATGCFDFGLDFSETVGEFLGCESERAFGIDSFVAG